MDEAWWPWLQILGGLIVLIVGGESLVRAASRLAAAFHISPVVIGLTVVAFGTSAPELAVSVQAATRDSADLAVGNAVGSNIFNTLFILGLSALIVPLNVASGFIRRDVPIMIGVAIFMLLFSLDGRIGRIDGLFLFVGIVAYVAWCIRESRRESADIQAEFAQEWPSRVRTPAVLWKNLLLLAIGLGLLILGARWLIVGSVEIARGLGVSEMVIGLTIVAVGTSLPEVATSLIAAIKNERDIAVGNVVGSNIFNVLCVLGLTGLVAPGGVEVSVAALRFDIPVMIAVSIACWPIFATGHCIARWEGALFLFYYVAYTSHVVLHAMGHELRHSLNSAMLTFVIPLTVLTLLISYWRHSQQPNTQE